MQPRTPKILISVPTQLLTLYASGSDGVRANYPISTSRFGTGTEAGSYKTPTGRFRISDRIGDGVPPWSVFRSRIPTGEIAVPGGNEDLVLTRILWLDGLDPDNANSRDRYIYIHGTNQEDAIGLPMSCGCVRMRNMDVISLFNQVSVGDEVFISDTAASQ